MNNIYRVEEVLDGFGRPDGRLGFNVIDNGGVILGFNDEESAKDFAFLMNGANRKRLRAEAMERAFYGEKK